MRASRIRVNERPKSQTHRGWETVGSQVQQFCAVGGESAGPYGKCARRVPTARGEIVDTTRDSRPENDNEDGQLIVGAPSERAQKLTEQHRAAHASLTEQWLKNEIVDGSVVRLTVEQRAVATAAS